MTRSSSALAVLDDSRPQNLGQIIDLALERKRQALYGGYRSRNATVDNFPDLLRFSAVVDSSQLASLWRQQPGYDGTNGYSSIDSYSLWDTGSSEHLPHKEALGSLPSCLPRHHATIREALGLLISHRREMRILLRGQHRIVALGPDMFNLYSYATIFHCVGRRVIMTRIPVSSGSAWRPSDLFIMRGIWERSQSAS
jgi:hypothetical protein